MKLQVGLQYDSARPALQRHKLLSKRDHASGAQPVNSAWELGDAAMRQCLAHAESATPGACLSQQGLIT